MIKRRGIGRFGSLPDEKIHRLLGEVFPASRFDLRQLRVSQAKPDQIALHRTGSGCT
jgi:hypothetical protein